MFNILSESCIGSETTFDDHFNIPATKKSQNEGNVVGNEPFSTAERSERVEIFFFAQRANTRKQASSRRPMPWRQQSRTAQARGAQMSCLSAEDQRRYNRTSLTSRAHRGSLSKRRELVLSSLPTLFSPILSPRSLKLRVSFPCIFAHHLYISYVQSYHFP